MERKLVFSSRAVTLCSRVLGDQIIFTPSHLFMFLSSMALLEGKDPVEKLNSSYWKAYKANLFVWPAVQAVNFSFTPLEHRVLAVNLVSLGECLPLNDCRLPPPSLVPPQDTPS